MPNHARYYRRPFPHLGIHQRNKLRVFIPETEVVVNNSKLLRGVAFVERFTWSVRAYTIFWLNTTTTIFCSLLSLIYIWQANPWLGYLEVSMFSLCLKLSQRLLAWKISFWQWEKFPSSCILFLHQFAYHSLEGTIRLIDRLKYLIALYEKCLSNNRG